MSEPIRIRVDATNPGQFFACCGLLEMASRLSADTLGQFEESDFVIADGPDLETLIGRIVAAEVEQLDTEDNTASPIQIPMPFDLRIDWWKSGDKNSSDLKVWAGTMESFRIARAMQSALKHPSFSKYDLFDFGVVVFDPDNIEKKVEPFYFDARRGPNAHSRDVGFSPNDIGITTIASPAVEFLCLVGLQRVRPLPAGKPRIFDYYTWSLPIPAILAPVACAGLLPDTNRRGYRFESWFRTGQRKHKAFITAKQIRKSVL